MPHEADLIVSMAQHVIPKGYTHTVQTTWINGDVEEGEFEDIYVTKGQSIIIKLQKADGRKGFKTMKEV